MLELKGKFSTAKVFTEYGIDEETTNQIYALLNSHIAKDSKIRIMPDTHAGAGNVIGLTMTINDKISPSLVGSDIGCGVLLMKFTTSKPLDLSRIDSIIRREIPYGYFQRDITKLKHAYRAEIYSITSALRFNRAGTYDRGIRGAGTLGGGNHFIEIYEGQDVNEYFIAVHTGSRSLGGEMYKYYNSRSTNKAYNDFIIERHNKIQELKDQGNSHLIQSELQKIKIKTEKENNLDRAIMYLEKDLMNDYLHDIKLVQKYAELNRIIIVGEILSAYLDYDEHIKTEIIADKPHNYVDTARMILRKGSQSALTNETVLIPINMRDGMIIGKASGDEDWNYSAPHGAGRTMSRTQAFENIDLETFKAQMEGIYSTTVGDDTRDEAPDAYKSLERILNDISKTISVAQVIKPIYNFKGGKEFKKRTENK